MVVELGEVASATRFNLFGPALYALDAYDSFREDVKVGWAWAAACMHRLPASHWHVLPCTACPALQATAVMFHSTLEATGCWLGRH